jgi:hypothetical protein
MIKRILLTLALAGSVMTGIAACNNAGGATTAPLASTAPLESTAPLGSPEASMGTEPSTESLAPLPSSS